MLLPPLCMLSVAMNAAAAAAHVIRGCACYHHHRMCHLWLCASPLWAMCVAPGPTVQSCNRKKKLVKKGKTKKKNTSHGSHHHREITAAGCVCRLQPCMLLLPLCILSVAMHITIAVHIAAVGHVYHHHVEPESYVLDSRALRLLAHSSRPS